MTKEETSEFYKWAFGEGPFEHDGIDRMKAWNEMHSEKSGLKLQLDGNILQDLAIMRMIWEYYKEKGEYPKACRINLM